MSLLQFLPAPVAIGDPEGRAVWVNPAFRQRFAVAGEVQGRPLAELFDGGAREAVLRAAAEVCQGGREARFRVRRGDEGFAAVAAPIEADGARVGLVFLFAEESAGEGVLAFHRELQEPLDELAQALDTLLEQTGGRRAERFRVHVETGLRAVERIRKQSDALAARVSGGRSAPATERFDPLELARAVGAAAARAARLAGHAFELRLPSGLPPVSGDAERLARALTRYAEERVEAARGGTSFALSARHLPAESCVLISLTEVAPAHSASFGVDDDVPPAALAAVVEPCGGAVARIADPVAGVTTAVRLPV
jgi:PAS domain-containing protein